MNKKTKEFVYRGKPTKKYPKGERYRFISEGYGCFLISEGYGCFIGYSLMARIRDGHRLYVETKNLTLEK